MAQRYCNAAAALGISLVATVIVSLPPFDFFRGISLDVLTSLRWHAFGRNHPIGSSPTVVIALDEETHRTSPFAGTPSVAWTREVGRILLEVVDSGAKAVGFDVVFPTSIEQSNMLIENETLGQRLRGFDRDFLRGLAIAARQQKILLGEVQHSDKAIGPAAGQRIAVGHGRNIRLLNVHTDPDGIVRRIPLFFTVEGKAVPSMTLELASRALHAEPQRSADGAVSLAGHAIPTAGAPNTITLNFEGGATDAPTFSLADLHGCIAKGDKDFFRRHFEGKVVLFGTVMDVEDRIITTKRFATAVEPLPTARCTEAAVSHRSRFARSSIPGVYIHATAVNNLIRNDAVREFSRLGNALVFLVVSIAAAACGLLLAPLAAVSSFVGIVIAGGLAALVAFRHAVALPVIDSVLAGSLALAMTVAYRFTVADKDKRFLRKSFALYLAPEVIEKMLKSNRLPELGGEVRTVTVFFSDVAGFSSLSEGMPPAELVAIMNEYLTAMTETIEAEGGLVDKYIGDAIVAVFGAPLDDPQHARHAVRAALNCQKRLGELNRGSERFKRQPLSQRIGINSGDALVGNIGSRRRLNYTAMGDTVNLASRLEGANRSFGTSIIASETTMGLAKGNFLWRELDTIRVKGRARPVRIFEPLVEADQEITHSREVAEGYADGLRCWRARDFAGAAECFGRLADKDPPAALFLQRARSSAAHPPGPDWQPVLTLEEK